MSATINENRDGHGCLECPNDGGANDCRHFASNRLNSSDGICILTANGKPLDCQMKCDRTAINDMMLDSKYPEFTN